MGSIIWFATMVLRVSLVLVSTFFVLGYSQAVCDLPGPDAIPCIECGPEHFACTDDDNESCDCPGLTHDDLGDCAPDLLACVDDDDDTCDCNLGRKGKFDGVFLKHRGLWGDWGSYEYCPGGSFVRGFRLKSAPDQGRWGDDTALNAIQLFCGYEPNFLTSSEADEGTWGNIAWCPDESIVNGLRLDLKEDNLRVMIRLL